MIVMANIMSFTVPQIGISGKEAIGEAAVPFDLARRCGKS
jgi:hypothetical protein